MTKDNSKFDRDREPIDQSLSGAGHANTLRKMIPYLWPPGEVGLKIRVIMAMLFLFGAKLVTVYLAFFYKDAVDGLTNAVESTGQNQIDLVYGIPLAVIVAYGLARFMSIGFAELRDVVFARVSQHAIRRLALQTFRHLHKLSLAFHLERRTGGLSRAIERGTRSIGFMLRFILFSVLPTFVEIGLVTVIFYRHFGPEYAFALLVAVVLYVAMTFLVTDWRVKFRRTMNKEDSAANTKAIDSLINYETVKYFGNETHESERYDSALASYQSAAIKSQYSLSLLNVGQSLVINGALVTAMVFAAFDVVDGRLTLGDFVLANTLLIQLFIPLNLLGFVYREIKNALVDMEQMFGLLARQPLVEDKKGAAEGAITHGHIRFDHVDFYYQPERQILRDVSFEVPAGKTIAIVGPSGAGKSTIARILYRFYDISGGSVSIDGVDIRDMTQASLRRAIGIVPQDTVLFNDSILYNIRYGRPDATRAEVEDAARLASIDSFITALPDGFDTVVGERGLKLSGGEKQRVAIARTILKQPPILLLDEATSALDTHTEREIQTALANITKGRTTLVIAHRLSTIVDADEIIVLDAGQIVERGAHQALLAENGVYAAMWARQQQMAEANALIEDLEQGE